MERARSTRGTRRTRLVKWLKLAALAIAGLCTVSIPVTIAFALSATGASDALTIGDPPTQRPHATPAQAVSRLRCVPERGYYALTFDDGPSRVTTSLVRALKDAGAVATFFDLGRRAAAHQDLVELQRSVGQVASHGYSHVPLSEFASERRVQELQATARVLDYPNAFLRPPDGATHAEVEADIRRSGLTPVHWTVDAGGLSAAAIVSAVRPGGIVRLREGSQATVAAVPAIVEGLRERGMCPGFLGSTSPVRAVKP